MCNKCQVMLEWNSVWVLWYHWRKLHWAVNDPAVRCWLSDHKVFRQDLCIWQIFFYIPEFLKKKIENLGNWILNVHLNSIYSACCWSWMHERKPLYYTWLIPGIHQKILNVKNVSSPCWVVLFTHKLLRRSNIKCCTGCNIPPAGHGYKYQST